MKHVLLVLLVGFTCVLFSCKKSDSLLTSKNNAFLDKLKIPECKAIPEDPNKSAARHRRWLQYLDSIISVNTGNLPKACLYLDFDGAKVENTEWNNGATMYFSPANLTEDQKKVITNNVRDDFSPFRVLVTRDSLTYAKADPMNRQRVIITDESMWAPEGGMAIINSSTLGNNTPCFVFSSLLGNNTKYVCEAVSHELGHTLGLYHQAVYDASCNEISKFNNGYGTGYTSFAPIMGIGFNKGIVNWYKGPTDYSCGDIQDDYYILSQRLGVWADDLNDVFSVITYADLPYSGVLNKAGDVDAVKIRLTRPKKVIVSSVNADIELDVYDTYFQLIETVNLPGTPNASIILNKGTYYLSVKAASNNNVSNQFMTGYYYIKTTSSF